MQVNGGCRAVQSAAKKRFRCTCKRFAVGAFPQTVDALRGEAATRFAGYFG
jgi:hypothetical protein